MKKFTLLPALFLVLFLLSGCANRANLSNGIGTGGAYFSFLNDSYYQVRRAPGIGGGYYLYYYNPYYDSYLPFPYYYDSYYYNPYHYYPYYYNPYSNDYRSGGYHRSPPSGSGSKPSNNPPPKSNPPPSYKPSPPPPRSYPPPRPSPPPQKRSDEEKALE